MLTSWVDLAVGELNTGRVTARQDDLPNQGVATNPQSQVDPCGLEFAGPMRAIAGRDPGCRGSNAAGWVPGEFCHGRGWFEPGLVAPATTSPPRNAT